MRQILVQFVFFYLFLDLPCLACECIRPSSIAQEFNHSSGIFIGNVVSISREKEEQKVRFRVDRYWKGINHSYIEVSSPMPDQSCGLHFVKGEQYLVYAFKNDAGMYVTNSCKRTQTRVAAKEDILYLGRGTTIGHLSGIWKQGLGICCTIFFSFFVFRYVSSKLK